MIRVTATVDMAVKTLLFLEIVVLVVERGREEEEEGEVVREREDEGGTRDLREVTSEGEQWSSW